MMKTPKVIPLNIELTDVITPKACASFVTELIKFIVYNKQQIPFPYERLKMFVLRRREHQKVMDLSNAKPEANASARVAFLMEKYYKKVEEAYEILDSTFKCIEHELSIPSECPVEEIVLLFGATPVSPKDVYRFQIPELSQGHSDKKHVWKKQISNLFRSIILSDELHTTMQRNSSLTNMFVMMKFKGRTTDSKWLLPKDQYRLSERAQQVCFSFLSVTPTPCSCAVEALTEQMEVLCTHDSERSQKDIDCDLTDQSVWFQTIKALKGFKDCKSDGKSLTDLWYLHNFIR